MKEKKTTLGDLGQGLMLTGVHIKENGRRNLKRTKIPEPNTVEWDRLAGAVARAYAPTIRPCRHCKYPVIQGYCCTNDACRSIYP